MESAASPSSPASSVKAPGFASTPEIAPPPGVDQPAARLSARHIPALDGLRGVAILSLLLFKSIEGLAPVTWSGKAVQQVFGCGWMGVDLFFVLSGFLISGILLDSKDAPHYFRNFYARRTLRVFPLYYAVLLVTFGACVFLVSPQDLGAERIVHNQGWLWTYTTNIAFLVKRSVFFDSGWLRFNHFWSLAIEEQFYLFWPLLIYLLPRRSPAIACGLLIVGALSLRIGLYFAHQRPGAMFYPTPCRLDSLAMGALIAIAVRSGRGLAQWISAAKRAALVSGAILLAVWIWRGKLDVNDVTTLTFGFTVVAVFAASILTLALDRSKPNRWAGWLEHRLLRIAGKYSYGMYVLHMLVIGVCDHLVTAGRMAATVRFEALGIVLRALLLFGATMGAGFISWHLYESHFLRAKRFFKYGQ